jgi:hypothetical protein
MMAQPAGFSSPGEWRSQAERSRHPGDNIFAQLAQAATMLGDRGQTEAQQLVHRAEAELQAGQNALGAKLLRAAARSCAGAPGYALGLQTLAEKIPPDPQQPGAKQAPARDENAPGDEGMPALDD